MFAEKKRMEAEEEANKKAYERDAFDIFDNEDDEDAELVKMLPKEKKELPIIKHLRGTKNVCKVSERSERALMRLLNYIFPLNSFDSLHSFCSCFIKNAHNLASLGAESVR